MKTPSCWSNPYAWLWFHLEAPFIKDPAARRPFTFIMRDFYHCRPLFTILILVWSGYAFGRWLLAPWFLVGVTIGLLLGHLFLTSKWVQGQQEEPPYPPGSAS